MRKKEWLCLCVMLPVYLGGMCACSGGEADAKDLEGAWDVTEVKGEKVGDEEGMPQMNFDMEEKILYGNAGCNLFNTTFTLDLIDRSVIRIEPGLTTKMACPHMELETKVLQTMDQVRAVKSGKSEQEICLVDEGGTVLFVLKREGSGI